jgi:hypothetical protein
MIVFVIFATFVPLTFVIFVSFVALSFVIVVSFVALPRDRRALRGSTFVIVVAGPS